MTLAELGMALRAEREKRGLSVESAANHLKIGARLLRALEEGDDSSMPPLAYTKGFIRSYAAYVGLSAEVAGEAIRALDAAAEQALPQNVYEPEIVLAPQRNLKPLFALVVLALLGGGLYVLWEQGAVAFWGGQTRRLAQPVPVQSPDAADRQGSANYREAPATTPPAAALPPVQAPARVGDAQPPRGAAPQALPEAQAPQGREAASGAAPQPGQEATIVGPHKVIITATEECWVHSTADNTDTRQFSLHKGDTFALTFSKSLELKLGNAGGVRLRYNGKEMPLAGQPGQVRSITFPPPAATRP